MLILNMCTLVLTMLVFQAANVVTIKDVGIHNGIYYIACYPLQYIMTDFESVTQHQNTSS